MKRIFLFSFFLSFGLYSQDYFIVNDGVKTQDYQFNVFVNANIYSNNSIIKNATLIEKDGKKYKQFYGMSSDTAMERYYGDIKNYRASEGETIALEYKGPIDKTIQQILGGLRSAATYVGAKDIKDLPKCTTFILKYR